ncbi:MAG: SDR family NAD(P)-dependent oxidoreductase [Verrucomicrobiota bacterium]
MDHALVLGADTRFGQSICRRLTTLGFRVFALARDFDNNPWEHPDFIKLPVDLTDTAAIAQQIDEIHGAGGLFTLVVNAVHYLPSQSEFENMPLGELEATLRLHLNLPIITARLTLSDLSQSHGNFVHIVPSSPVGSTSAVSVLAAQEPLKAALNALQNERHHTGLRITHIYPYFLGTTKVKENDDEAETVKVGIDSQSRLDPESVSDVIEALITGREGNFATEIHIRPRTPRDASPLARTHVKPSGYAAIKLPPSEKAAPDQELIPTAKPIDPIDAKNRPVTYADVIDSYDEEAEEEFERRISGVSETDPEDEDFELVDSEEPETEPLATPRSRERRKKDKKRPEPKVREDSNEKSGADDKSISAKTLRNRERRRKWKERKARERAEAREKENQIEADASSESSEPQASAANSRDASVEHTMQGHAAAIAAAKSSSEPITDNEAPNDKPTAKKTPRKKAAAKKKRAAAKKAVQDSPTQDLEEKAAPKKRSTAKKTPAKKKTSAAKKAPAKKKRAPAKKAPNSKSESP